VASSTFGTILLCEAAGYDRILVETVGVGQSELEAGQLTDACVLLLVAGAGDDLQAVKRGVMEAADFILINKADGENRDRARIAARELNQVSSLWAMRPGGNRTQVHFASSIENGGLKFLADSLEPFCASLRQNGFFLQNRSAQEKKWFQRVLWNSLEEMLKGENSLRALMAELQQKKEGGLGLVELLSELQARIGLVVKNPK
jgi:LAO/AO transport system kinase